MTDLVEARLRRAFTRVADGTAIPPVPGRDGGSGGGRRWRRRSTAIVALGVVAVGVGVPVVAAAGGSAISTAFGWTHQPPLRAAPGQPPALPVIAADDATGREVLSLRQDGETWEIWVAATSPGGGRCVSVLQPVTGGYTSHGSECTAAVPAGVDFGAGGGDSTGWVTQIDATGAASVTLSEGARLLERLPVGDGETAAWIPAAWYGRSITLTGYTAAGAVVGTMTETFSMILPGLPARCTGAMCPHTGPGPVDVG